MLVANHGMRREAFVEPSTGSSTASSSCSKAPSLSPDSSLSTPRPARGENLDRNRVGHEVGPVLSRPGPSQSPVAEPAQRERDRVGCMAKDLEKLGSVHTTEP